MYYLLSKNLNFENSSLSILTVGNEQEVIQSNNICGLISLLNCEMHGIQCMPCSSRIISEMLPEVHTMQNMRKEGEICWVCMFNTLFKTAKNETN